MKSSTPESMKFKRLQRRLNTGRKETVGLLELLWLATAKNAPQGDIGRFCNEEIAIECDWNGDHDELVAALLDCGWLDHHDECRLVVHDWADHAPNHVASGLKRWGKTFIVPKEPPMEPPKEPPMEPPKDVPPSQAKPSEAKRSVTNPNLSAAAMVAADDAFKDLDADEVTRQANKLLRACRNNLPAEFIWQSCCIAEILNQGMIAEITTKIGSGGVKKPKSYIEAALREESRKLGFDWRELLPLVPKPVYKEPAVAH